MPGKTAKVQCDASAMFSPDMVKRFVVPALAEQCEWLDYAMFHLDDEANATPNRPSVVRVELCGNWQMAATVPGVTVEESRNGVTVLLFTCRDGATREVVLKGNG